MSPQPAFPNARPAKTVQPPSSLDLRSGEITAGSGAQRSDAPQPAASSDVIKAPSMDNGLPPWNRKYASIGSCGERREHIHHQFIIIYSQGRRHNFRSRISIFRFCLHRLLHSRWYILAPVPAVVVTAISGYALLLLSASVWSSFSAARRYHEIAWRSREQNRRRRK